MSSIALEASSPRYGTAWLRFCALVVDGVIVGGPSWLAQRLGAHWSAPAMLALMVAIAVAGHAYVILLHGWHGQTVGKRLLRVKVLDAGGGPLSMRQSVLRDLPWLLFAAASFVQGAVAMARGVNPFVGQPSAGWLDALLLAWVVAEVATMLLSERRRALHDFIARSVVVRLDVT